MQTIQKDFYYKQVSEKDKKFLQEYIQKKDQRFETLISAKDLDSARLDIKAEKFAKKEAFKVELNLHLPKQSFKSSEDDHTIIEAFDIALDKLIIQLRKYNDKNK